jgi:ribonucleotide monophosphatase NagD (HAD superfamily)
MVGDRWTTDGLFARALGCPFALVRTGVTPVGVATPDPPAFDAPDLAAVADAILAAGPTARESGEG